MKKKIIKDFRLFLDLDDNMGRLNVDNVLSHEMMGIRQAMYQAVVRYVANSKDLSGIVKDINLGIGGSDE